MGKDRIQLVVQRRGRGTVRQRVQEINAGLGVARITQGLQQADLSGFLDAAEIAQPSATRMMQDSVERRRFAEGGNAQQGKLLQSAGP